MICSAPNFYVAAKRDNAAKADFLADTLKAIGWKQVYRWTTHGDMAHKGPDVVGGLAVNYLAAIEGCDVFMAILPAGEGTSAEIGAALMAKRPVMLFDPDGSHHRLKAGSSCFHFHPACAIVPGPLTEKLIHLVAGVLDDFATPERRAAHEKAYQGYLEAYAAAHPVGTPA